MSSLLSTKLSDVKMPIFCLKINVNKCLICFQQMTKCQTAKIIVNKLHYVQVIIKKTYDNIALKLDNYNSIYIQVRSGEDTHHYLLHTITSSKCQIKEE